MVRVIVQDTLKNREWVGYDAQQGFAIGRDSDCALCLHPSKFVSRRHLFAERTEDGWQLLVNSGAGAVTVDGDRVGPGDSKELKPYSEVRIAEFVLKFIQGEDEAALLASHGEEDLNELQRSLHANVLKLLDLRTRGTEAVTATTNALERISELVDQLLDGEYRARVLEAPTTRARMLATALELRMSLLVASGENPLAADHDRVETPGRNSELEDEVTQVLGMITEDIGWDPEAASDADMVDALGQKTLDWVNANGGALATNVVEYAIGLYLKKVVCDMIFGLGPLQDLLDSQLVSEIMIVSPELVYIERAGKVIRSNKTFLGDEALLAVIDRIVAPLGRRVDRSSPMVDARLSDGSRVNAVVPPLALKGPCVTIRRFPTHRITIEDMIKWGAVAASAQVLLDAFVKARKNIVVAGGTGSGKTTWLNVLSGFIKEDERLVTVEDSAELQLAQEHVVSLETRPANVEGAGGVSIHDLVRNALRMRPDRVIVGECRGGEAFDMLQAMNTGHDGSMTTVHANSSLDTISRIETMCMMAVEIPIQAIRHQVTQAVDIIVFIRRLRGGRRIVEQITEVLGVDPATGEPELRDLMLAVGVGQERELRPTGYLPTFLADLLEKGLIDLEAWFKSAGPQ